MKLKKEEIIQKMSEFLTSRERRILEMRLEGDTLQKIGQEFRVTRERIRQLGIRITGKTAKTWPEKSPSFI